MADFSRTNAEKLAEGVDVIVDGLDNFESRFLINDVALKLGLPWVYGGAVASSGMTATFLPHEPPCFRCLVSGPPAGGTMTCDTAGVVNAAVGASRAAVDANWIPYSHQVGQTGKLPGSHIVEFPIQHGPFGAVAEVIEHNDDRVEAVSGRGG